MIDILYAKNITLTDQLKFNELQEIKLKILIFLQLSGQYDLEKRHYMTLSLRRQKEKL